MAQARDEWAWDHTSALLAMMINVKAKKGRWLSPEKLHPHRHRRREKRVRPRHKEGIGILKVAFGGRSGLKVLKVKPQTGTAPEKEVNHG